MTGRRPKKAASGVVLRWQGTLIACPDIPHHIPPRYAVIAVAAVLVRHADSDGRNCRPAIDTVKRESGISHKTVLLVLRWMVDSGWLLPTQRISRRPTVYRLTFPVGVVGDLPEQPVGPLVGPLVGVDGDHNLRPPTLKEGGREVAVAPSVCTPVAATISAGPPDLFSDQVVEDGTDSNIEVDDEMVERVACAIASDADMEIEASRLGPALMAAKARASDWIEQDFVEHCVKKLLQHQPAFPTGFLVADLGKLQGGTVPPRIARRKLFVDLADEIEALDARLRSDDPWMAIDDLPVSRFNDLLIEADLIIDGDGWIPEEIPDAQFEQFIKLARKALRETRRA